MVMRAREPDEHALSLKITELNEQRRQRNKRLALAAVSPLARKKMAKAFRRDDKALKKGTSVDKSANQAHERVWVLDFHGDIKASATEHFSEEISALMDVAEQQDEVVIRLESAGGLVHAYGLAAAQLDRLRDAGLKTTVCIDKVAASGGYLMACTAEHIKAAEKAVWRGRETWVSILWKQAGQLGGQHNVARCLKLTCHECRHAVDLAVHDALEGV